MIQKHLITKHSFKLSVCAVVSVIAIQLAGCSSPMPTRAPVEDRSSGMSGNMNGNVNGNLVRPSIEPPAYPSAYTTNPAIDSKPLPNLLNAQNAGKPGYYSVKPGDTVMQIGRNTNQNWRDIVKWNNLESANQIEVGQVLRVAPFDGAGVIAIKPLPITPLPPSATPMPAQMPPPVQPSSSSTTSEDDIAWIWPSGGTLISGYDEIKSKGLKIAGRLGDPVLASADGRVVYAGSGLRGYGNLVILKHNETYLTAYAHNQTLLVKEDQTVRKGQRIADMGSSDAERVMLHFEVRRNGKPVDPAKYLPGR
jgi:lipoprotein NlpD